MQLQNKECLLLAYTIKMLSSLFTQITFFNSFKNKDVENNLEIWFDNLFSAFDISMLR